MRRCDNKTRFAVRLSMLAWLCAAVGGCAVTRGIVPSQTGTDWKPALSNTEITTVQQTFPSFAPELFAPQTSVTNSNSNLSPSNFSPAKFFGPSSLQGFKPTPLGISLETNGYDGPQMPLHFPANGTYFDRLGNPLQFNLGTVTRSPENILEGYMGVPQKSGAPVMTIDLSMGKVDPVFIDQFMLTLRDQLAIALPAIANVDPANCEIIIEPTIFYVNGGNFSPGYAGGLTESLGNNRYRIHVQAFYMTSPQNVSNWADYLIDEGLNFYVKSVGRDDLAR